MITALFTPSLRRGQGGAFGQSLTQNSISTIAKSDPLIITGAIGTQNTYYNSSMGSGYRSPWSNSFYANLNVSLYGISMPFAFYYSNDNTSFNFPHISFHIDPTYKNWRGHFGRSNMNLSSYIMGMSFNGIGIEYNGSKLRFGAFYGELRNAINDDPNDPSARKPQYRRLGWGFKVGYGTGLHYLDLYLLRAYDRLNSVDPYWQDRINPQENIAVAVRGGLGLTKWLSLSGNLAFSAFSSDTRAERIHSDNLDKWENIFSARYTSLMRIATDVSGNLNLNGLNASIYYKMVQPDYTTLGLYYTSNNYQSLGINASTSLFKVLSVSGNFSWQEDNITHNQLFTTSGYVYSASVGTNVGRLSLSANYSGYRQIQNDGKAHVNDTTRVNRLMHSFSFTPSYSIEGDNVNNVFSFTSSYTQNKDLNIFATGESDVKCLALGLSHSIDIKSWEMNFNTSLSHQQSDGYKTRYTSDVLSFGTGRSFLKEKALSTSINFNLCYNKIQNMQKMLSMGVDFSANYTLAKVHSFTFGCGFNKYSDTNISADHSSMGTSEFTASLGYTYTFSLLEIKKKAVKGNSEE